MSIASVASYISDKCNRLWLPIAAVVGLVLAIPVLHSSLFDDAYIHSRIAENLINYGQPYFNLGEKFKASSSTGYTFVLAGMGHLFAPVTSIRILEVICIFATVLGIFYLAHIKQVSTLRRYFVAATVLPTLLWAAYGGMETPIIGLIIVFAAIADHYKKDNVVVLIISIGVWFRFELIALLLLVLFFKGYWIGAIPPKYIEQKKLDFVVSMPVFSMAFRSSPISQQYNVYDCEIGASYFVATDFL